MEGPFQKGEAPLRVLRDLVVVLDMGHHLVVQQLLAARPTLAHAQIPHAVRDDVIADERVL